MKKILCLMAIVLPMVVLCSCGVSSEKKDRMQTSAHVALSECGGYNYNVELSNIRKGKIAGTDTYYVADFDYKGEQSFSNNTPVVLNGIIGFNEYGNVARLDSNKGRYAVDITSVRIGGKEVPVAESPYNYHKFLSFKGTVDTEEVKFADPNEKKHKRDAAIAELKSWGAKDAYMDGDVIVYVADESDITGNPYDVAWNWYGMYKDVPGVKGFRIVSASTRKTLGEYPN